MAAHVKCNPPKVSFSATQDNFKCLQLAEEGQANAVTVRVTRECEEVIVDEEDIYLKSDDNIQSLSPKSCTFPSSFYNRNKLFLKMFDDRCNHGQIHFFILFLCIIIMKRFPGSNNFHS